eukprot:1159287-Pelagomonas_calceolata.AAC.8
MLRMQASPRTPSLGLLPVAHAAAAATAAAAAAAAAEGLPIVKQHQAVAAILKDDIAKWHGMQLTTRASEPQAPVSS